MLTLTPMFGKASIWHIAPDSWDILVWVKRDYQMYLLDQLRKLPLSGAKGKTSTQANKARGK